MYSHLSRPRVAARLKRHFPRCTSGDTALHPGKDFAVAPEHHCWCSTTPPFGSAQTSFGVWRLCSHLCHREAVEARNNKSESRNKLKILILILILKN